MAPMRADTDNGLPLYKDKPFAPRSSTRKQRQLRRTVLWTVGAVAAVVMIVRAIGGGGYSGPGLRAGRKKAAQESWADRQAAVRQAFEDSWRSYEETAWGMDVYRPVSKTSRNMAPEGMGWIIVDALDTMLIMNLTEPAERARTWIAQNLTYDQDYEVNTFETTIRMLGGLLSAHYLSGLDEYLDKATDLGNRLLGAFDSPTGVPYASVNLRTGKGRRSMDIGGASSTAEAATVQLELKYLTKLTGETLFWEKAEKVFEVLDGNHAPHGLVPIYVSPETGQFAGRTIRLGSRGDSYYEYELKQYLQTGRRETVYKAMYDESMAGVHKKLVRKSKPRGLTFIAELDNGIDGATSPKMDHLVCFLAGNLALGATEGATLELAQRTRWTARQAADMALAKELMHTCVQMYDQTATGLAPEIAWFNEGDGAEDMVIKSQDAHNLQRPETVESLFVLWRITRDPIYREWGWRIFQAFQKYARLEDGSYTSLNNVNVLPPDIRDNMESFWLAETLKYLYLLFDDDTSVLPLDAVVFNTEGHPFPRFDMGTRFKTGWQRSAAA
ncbi:glycoside hydrolase [Dipodascopsis tothii]|uniref:glycoside hydrolase n=1 Tax=Dipodascopsis tothii TaxID=44089 RepID=UPI0034CE5017